MLVTEELQIHQISDRLVGYIRLSSYQYNKYLKYWSDFVFPSDSDIPGMDCILEQLNTICILSFLSWLLLLSHGCLQIIVNILPFFRPSIPLIRNWTHKNTRINKFQDRPLGRLPWCRHQCSLKFVQQGGEGRHHLPGASSWCAPWTPAVVPECSGSCHFNNVGVSRKLPAFHTLCHLLCSISSGHNLPSVFVFCVSPFPLFSLSSISTFITRTQWWTVFPFSRSLYQEQTPSKYQHSSASSTSESPLKSVSYDLVLCLCI